MNCWQSLIERLFFLKIKTNRIKKTDRSRNTKENNKKYFQCNVWFLNKNNVRDKRSIEMMILIKGEINIVYVESIICKIKMKLIKLMAHCNMTFKLELEGNKES